MGCAGWGGALAVLLVEAGTLDSSHTLSLEGQVWVGRAGQGPEVCNLLRHLKIIKNFMLGRYRIPVAVAMAQRGARGESGKAVGSSRGGNWDVPGIWQGRRPPGSLVSLGWAQRGLSPGGVRPSAGCTDVLLWGGENTRRRGPSKRSVFAKPASSGEPAPGTLVCFAEPLFRRGARGFTDQHTEVQLRADNQQRCP